MLKKVLRSFLVTMALFCLAACGGENSQSVSPAPDQEAEKEFNLEEYKTAVSECRDAINEAGILVANVGSYEINYCNALASISGKTAVTDEMVEKAFDWLAEKADVSRETVDKTYDNIRQQYKDIILIEIDGQEAKEIDSSFRGLYDAYDSMYSLTTSPSGLASDFANKFQSYVTAMVDIDKDLSLFLDE